MGMLSELKELIASAKERDPAAVNSAEILLTYSGVHAIFYHRINHWLWKKKVPFFPRALSQMCKFFTGIEIHPGAKIGNHCFIDHGMGVVIGETTTIGDKVTIYQGVTLGGTGKERGKRHPTIGNNVVISAGAKVLGSITIGNNVIIGAGAVVINSVPDDSTVVGVPGRVVKVKGEKILSDEYHRMKLPDPVNSILTGFKTRIKSLEKEVQELEKKLNKKNKSEKNKSA